MLYSKGLGEIESTDQRALFCEQGYQWSQRLSVVLSVTTRGSLLRKSKKQSSIGRIRAGELSKGILKMDNLNRQNEAFECFMRIKPIMQEYFDDWIVILHGLVVKQGNLGRL